MSVGKVFQSFIFLVLAVGLGAAYGADMATKTPPASTGCAVDGVNGKLGGYGGEFSDKTDAAGEGALAIPLGCAFGAQLDGAAGSFDGSFIGTLAGHLFWRNPAQGLLGAYADFTDWNRFGGVNAAHVGPEAEAYLGRFTLQGVTGVEFGNSQSGTVGSSVETFDVRTRFFDEANLAYYPIDNWEVYVGHRYLGGLNAAAFGSEWGVPMAGGSMAALFTEATVGEHSDHGVWGGVRFYLGQKSKTLMRRHREDDPTSWNNGSAAVSGGGAGFTPIPSPSSACLPLGSACSASSQCCSRFCGNLGHCTD